MVSKLHLSCRTGIKIDPGSNIFPLLMQSGISCLLILMLTYFGSAGDPPAVPLINIVQLRSMAVQPSNDTLYVVNFWASWCKPCIEEMPYFRSASDKLAGSKIKFLFVSLDFVSESARVSKFVEKRKMKDVFHLNEKNPNDWIDQIDSGWSGAIPATVFYKAGEKKYFREGEFTRTELDSIIQINIQ